MSDNETVSADEARAVEIADRGVGSVEDALVMADAIIDDPDGGVEWLMDLGCDVIAHLRDEVRRLRAQSEAAS